MGPLGTKVIATLRKTFPAPATVEYVEPSPISIDGSADSDDPEDFGIVAVVVSDVFEGLDGFARQTMVWQPLDEILSFEEKRRIAIIVTSTFAEKEYADLVQPSEKPTPAGPRSYEELLSEAERNVRKIAELLRKAEAVYARLLETRPEPVQV